MKLSQSAKQQDTSYRAALRWLRAGAVKGEQASTGTIIVTAGESAPARPETIAPEARVSSPEHWANMERRAARLWE